MFNLPLFLDWQSLVEFSTLAPHAVSWGRIFCHHLAFEDSVSNLLGCAFVDSPTPRGHIASSTALGRAQAWVCSPILQREVTSSAAQD